MGKTRKLAREVGYLQARCQITEATLEEIALTLKDEGDHRDQILLLLGHWRNGMLEVEKLRRNVLQLSPKLVQ